MALDVAAWSPYARAMTQIHSLFVTKVYRTMLRGKAVQTLNEDLGHAARALAADDAAGQSWSAEKNYPGYTSYASLNDLTWRSPEFADLQRHLDTHALAFAKELDFDLGGTPLALSSLWVNLLDPGGWHTAHIHPHSVLSGTYYVEVPPGSGAIRFEDPRHAFMMAAPPRKVRCKREQQSFVTFDPKPGMLLLWESWLRHEVPINRASEPRLSISFNYGWGES